MIAVGPGMYYGNERRASMVAVTWIVAVIDRRRVWRRAGARRALAVAIRRSTSDNVGQHRVRFPADASMALDEQFFCLVTVRPAYLFVDLRVSQWSGAATG